MTLASTNNPMNWSDKILTGLVLSLSAMSFVGGLIFLAPYVLAGLVALTAVMVPVGYVRGAFKEVN